MKKESNDHISRKHWKVIPAKCVPYHKRCLPMAWLIKRKRNHVGDVIKWKVRLCANGHCSAEFADCWDTYSPTVLWQTIRLVFILAIINNWYIRSINFVLDFPQAKVQTDIYMHPPKAPTQFNIPDLPKNNDRFKKVYKILNKMYSLKDTGRTWNEHLRKGLFTQGWKQSPIDECLYIE